MQELQLSHEFQKTLDELDKLSREHLLYFRLEVGRLLLEQFYAGDITAYKSQDPFKPNGFVQFTKACGGQLAEIGLSESLLRQCMLGHAVVKGLPVHTAKKLVFSQVLALTSVQDAQTRVLLAEAAVENRWTSVQLRDAVKAQKKGKWIDGDLKMPGMQPPKQTPRLVAPQAGRLVAQAEKWAKQIADWKKQWKKIHKGKVSAVQAERLKTAVAALKAALVGLR